MVASSDSLDDLLASLAAYSRQAYDETQLRLGSGWVPVGFADFKSVGPGPSVGAVGSTPSRSRHLCTGLPAWGAGL